jgi:pyruvate/2-oxoacid:ferredoxin oxidoreductase beta subunit
LSADSPNRNVMASGHLGCPGCGEALGLRLVLQAIGENLIMVVPACCASYVDGIWPHSSGRVPILHVSMGAAAAAAAGVRAALEVQGRNDTHVLAWAGGSGAFDAGIHAISSAAERNENILYICYNNESYAQTDFHYNSAGANGRGAGSGASRHRYRPHKNIMEIMASHAVPYCATACVAYPEDLTKKVKKALSTPGFKFMHLLSPCPTNWQMPSELSIELTRSAVLSRMFPLYEVENGQKYTVNIIPEAYTPVTKFLSRQGRFASLGPDSVRHIQSHVESQWKWLLSKAELSSHAEQRSVKSKPETPAAQ